MSGGELLELQLLELWLLKTQLLDIFAGNQLLEMYFENCSNRINRIHADDKKKLHVHDIVEQLSHIFLQQENIKVQRWTIFISVSSAIHDHDLI
jgi:hypothetical protein